MIVCSYDNPAELNSTDLNYMSTISNLVYNGSWVRVNRRIIIGEIHGKFMKKIILT